MDLSIIYISCYYYMEINQNIQGHKFPKFQKSKFANTCIQLCEFEKAGPHHLIKFCVYFDLVGYMYRQAKPAQNMSALN